MVEDGGDDEAKSKICAKDTSGGKGNWEMFLGMRERGEGWRVRRIEGEVGPGLSLTAVLLRLISIPMVVSNWTFNAGFFFFLEISACTFSSVGKRQPQGGETHKKCKYLEGERRPKTARTETGS